MYEWVDPISGSLQMSGKPPAWYRSSAGGPRVRVFDQGVIVDDTAIDVPADQRQALREDAFRQFEDSKELQALKRLETEAIQDAEREQRRLEQTEIVADDFEEPEPEVPESISERTIEQLKDLLDQWDQINFQ